MYLHQAHEAQRNDSIMFSIWFSFRQLVAWPFRVWGWEDLKRICILLSHICSTKLA